MCEPSRTQVYLELISNFFCINLLKFCGHFCGHNCFPLIFCRKEFTLIWFFKEYIQTEVYKISAPYLRSKTFKSIREKLNAVYSIFHDFWTQLQSEYLLENFFSWSISPWLSLVWTPMKGLVLKSINF